MRAIENTITTPNTRQLWAVLDIGCVGDENHDPIVGVYMRKWMAQNYVDSVAEVYRRAGGVKSFKTLDGWNLGDRQLRVIELPPAR